MNPGKLQLLVAIVNYKTSLSKPRAGVCTKWMAHLKPNDNVSFEISKGSMKLPIDNTPIILIGPGTGIAPMRSFLQDRIFDGINSNILVFGARNREMDFFFKDEFESYTRTGLTLFTAFSRDQREKVYVQDRIIENSELIWDAIANKGAFVYLSGNAKSMPDDVKDAFKKVIKLCGNMSDIESDEYFKELKISGRFQQECWS